MESNVKFDGPRSICTCGHSGDGPHSYHEAGVKGLADGHGPCIVAGCDCQKFSWKAFTPEFQEALQAHQEAAQKQDETEEPRRAMVDALNAEPGSREALEAEHGDVFDTQQLQEAFTVNSFLAPFVSVTRKSDGVKGVMAFQHHPRFYFDFQPA
jgi:hypothetical protein